MNGSRSRTLHTMINAVAAATSHVGSSLLGLLATPFILQALGLQAYGLWAFAMSFRYLLSVSDLGLAQTYYRFVPFYAARDEKHKVRQIATFGILFYIGLGTIISPIVLLAAPFAMSALHLTEPLKSAAPLFLTEFTALFFLTYAFRTLGWLLTGIGELKLSSFYDAIGQTSFSIFAVIFTRLFHFGMNGMLLALIIQLAITTVLTYAMVRRRFGPLYVNPFRLEGSVIMPLFKLGGWLQLGTLASLLSGESDQIVIGVLFGIDAVGLYEVGAKIARAIKAQGWYVFSAFAPAVSALQAQEGDARLNDGLLRLNRYVGMLSFGTTGFAIAFASYILVVWLGPTYGQNPVIIGTVVILGTAYAFDVMSGGAITILNVMNRPRYQAYAAGIGLAVHVIFTLVLSRFFGVLGAISGNLIASIVVGVYFNRIFYPLRGLSLMRDFGALVGKLVLAVIISAGLSVALTSGLPHSFANERLNSIVHLIVGGTIYTGLMLWSLRLLSVLHVNDISLVTTLLPKRLRVAPR